LTPGTGDKAPDGHWALDPARIPVPFVNSFPVNSRTGNIAPQLVLEVAVSNESMSHLTQVDLVRYFAPGTGTRAWMGIKVFKDKQNVPPIHRWSAGWAARDQANGQFLDRASLDAESMPIVPTNNIAVSILTNIIFHIDVNLLLSPMPRPVGYPPTLDIDLEIIRQTIISVIA
jgi:hypothetical protein